MGDYEGFCEGEKCNRDGCAGIIIHEREGCCSCHINPPCGYCTDDGAYCPVCNWSNEHVVPAIEYTPPFRLAKTEVKDDGKLYDVRRYFDDFLESTVYKGLSRAEAVEKANKLNSTPRYYVSYSVHLTDQK